MNEELSAWLFKKLFGDIGQRWKWNDEDEKKYQQIKKLIEQKPRVSRASIYAYVDLEWDDCDYRNQPPESYDIKAMIINFLKSKGIEVEE